MEETVESQNPKNVKQNPNSSKKKNPKVVIVMGATGAGKSRLAIDLASHFPIEIINADSMQVYKGLDVLTNKVTLDDQKGIPHHLLGTVSPTIEFTSKDFRDSAIPIIDDIVSRNRLPVIVGGTNYYIQALVTPFLLDESMEDMDESCLNSSSGEKQLNCTFELDDDGSTISYDRLKEIDSDAANRIHPNDHRKLMDADSDNGLMELGCAHAKKDLVGSNGWGYWKWIDPTPKKQVGSVNGNEAEEVRVPNAKELYTYMKKMSSMCPTKQTFQRKGFRGQKWGRVDNSRYDCCFICVDASLPVLDQFVDQRVDCMITAGLLNEVVDIYNENANYTRGIRQAIGVREFEDFLKSYLSNSDQEKSPKTLYVHIKDKDCDSSVEACVPAISMENEMLKENVRAILDSDDSHHKDLLNEAIDKLKTNTRRLVRRQKRRLHQLQTVFGWDLHYVDATDALLGDFHSSWPKQVIEPSINIIKTFLRDDVRCISDSEMMQNDIQIERTKNPRDLWSQYVCEACEHRILRGSHEWEQHKMGRGHRKRVLNLKKKSKFLFDRAASVATTAETETTTSLVLST